MPVYLIGSERESLTMRSEDFKRLVKDYLMTRGFTIDLDSGIEGSFPDLGGYDPAGNRVYIEAKDMKVGIGNSRDFLVPLGKHLLAYMNQPYKLVFAIRELRTVSKFKATFKPTVENDTLMGLSKSIVDVLQKSGMEELVEGASRIEKVDLDMIRRFVLDTEIINGRYMEWAIQKRVGASVGHQVPSEPISESSAPSREGVRATIDDIFNLKDDVSRKEVLLECISGPENENLKKALMILDKFFPDDFDVISTVIENLDGWSDQTVEDALVLYLVKTTDNRIPDVVFKVALDPKRGKPFRKVFFRLLGEVGRPDQLDELEHHRDRERDGIIKGWVNGAIEGTKSRSPRKIPSEDYYRTSFGHVLSERVLRGKECYWKISDALREIIRLYKIERKSEWHIKSLNPSDIVMKLVARQLDDIQLEIGLCAPEHQELALVVVKMIQDAGVLLFHPTEGRTIRRYVRKAQDTFARLSVERNLKGLL